MKAIVLNFRGSYKTNKATNHVIIGAEGVNRKEAAEKLIGKNITWTNSKGTEIKGKIASTHGNKGVVRAIFERGLPGQALGKEVKIE